MRRLAHLTCVAVVVCLLAAVGWACVRSDPRLAPLSTILWTHEAAGYDRSCSTGRGCVFGQAWSDDVAVAGGHNGCDTRNDQLRAQLRDITLKRGTRGCVVTAGLLVDPYTGARVEYVRGSKSDGVDVDHVLPLSVAWDRGASGWSADRRRDFANDPRGLVVTTAAANRSKGDRMPGAWSPKTARGRCLYAQRFTDMASTYDIPLTPTELITLRVLLTSCATTKSR